MKVEDPGSTREDEPEPNEGCQRRKTQASHPGAAGRTDRQDVGLVADTPEGPLIRRQAEWGPYAGVFAVGTYNHNRNRRRVMTKSTHWSHAAPEGDARAVPTHLGEAESVRVPSDPAGFRQRPPPMRVEWRRD